MIKKFNELFEVNAQDTLGDAIIKGATKGFIQGAIGSAIGIGVFAIAIKVVENNYGTSDTEEEIEDDLEDTPETVRQGAYSPHVLMD